MLGVSGVTGTLGSPHVCWERGCEGCCAPTITPAMAKYVMQTLALQWRLTPAHPMVTLAGFCQGLSGEKRGEKRDIFQKKLVVAIDHSNPDLIIFVSSSDSVPGWLWQHSCLQEPSKKLPAWPKQGHCR